MKLRVTTWILLGRIGTDLAEILPMAASKGRLSPWPLSLPYGHHDAPSTRAPFLHQPFPSLSPGAPVATACEPGGQAAWGKVSGEESGETRSQGEGWPGKLEGEREKLSCETLLQISEYAPTHI